MIGSAQIAVLLICVRQPLLFNSFYYLSGTCPLCRDQTVMISLVFASTALSTFLAYSSVSFWSSSRSSSCSSSDISLAFWLFLMTSLPSRLILRIATLAPSPFFLISFARSLRRSSVSSGNTSLMVIPSLVGVMPISEARIAFSIAFISFDYHG